MPTYLDEQGNEISSTYLDENTGEPISETPAPVISQGLQKLEPLTVQKYTQSFKAPSSNAPIIGDERIFNPEPFHSATKENERVVGESLANKTGSFWPTAIGSGLYNLASAIPDTAVDVLSDPVSASLGMLSSLKSRIPQIAESALPTDMIPRGVSSNVQRPTRALLPESTATYGPDFISGSEGTAINRPHLYDLGPNPETLSGTVLPQEFGEVNKIPPELPASGITNPKPEGITGEGIIPPREYFTGEGHARPGEPQLPSAPARLRQKINEIDPETVDGNSPLPPLDNTLSDNIDTTEPETLNLPSPGQAKPSQDVSAIGANLTSPHNVLMDRPETVGVVKPILEANDAKYKFIANTERDFAELTKGLDKQSRTQLYDILDTGISSGNADLDARAESAKKIFASIYDQLPEGTGNIPEYITHIAAEDPDLHSALKSIFDYHNVTGLFEKQYLGPTGESIGDNLYEKALGNPDSPFVLHRTGQLNEMEKDVNKVFPAYTESIARLIFDKPAVDAAKEALASVPESKLKELAAWYIKNYTHYDAEQGLHRAWNGFANQIATTTARSIIGLNPGIHMLHAGEIPASLYPELGLQWTLKGIKDTVGSSLTGGNWDEMARLGLLQGNIRPFRFQSVAEKLDSITYGMNYVESLVKGIGYNGAKAMFKSRGFSEKEASLRALQMTKDLTYSTDAARSMKGFSPESNIMGGEIASRLGGQFKQIPTKIVEQFINRAMAARQEPAKFARAVAGAGIAFAGTTAGLHTFHINPASLAKNTALGAFGDVMQDIYKDLAKGDWQQALVDTAAWLTPGGKNIQQFLTNKDKYNP